MNKEFVLTANEAGALIGRSAQWIRAQAASGRLAHVRIGAAYRFSEDTVKSLIQKVEPQHEFRIL